MKGYKPVTQQLPGCALNEFDLGKTHLVEHHIETGDAAPVKLPPRCIPLAFADGRLQGVREPEKERSYPALNMSLGSTFGYGLETVWSTYIVPRLQEVECSNKGCDIPDTPCPGLFRCSSWTNYFLNNGYNSSLSPNSCCRGRHSKDGIHYQVWAVLV